MPIALEALPVALPTAVVALSAAPLTAATGADLWLPAFGLLFFRLLARDFVLVLLVDEPRERAGVFFEPPERFAEGLALA